MITERIIALIDESILLEQNVSSLYNLFSQLFPEDQAFWWQLHLEEKSHAMLLRSGRDSFINRGTFPEALLADSINDLKKANAFVEEQTAKCTKTPPSRIEAGLIAANIEAEAGEKHYTRFMNKDATSGVETVFQQLNRNDKDHERRIKTHLKRLQQDRLNQA